MSSAQYRVIPAKNPGVVKRTLGGDVTLVYGTAYDIPFEHARTVPPGTLVVCGLSGPTSGRPANARCGEHYTDTTLSKVIFADGAGLWYDPISGGTV